MSFLFDRQRKSRSLTTLITGALLLLPTLGACTRSSDSCDDLEGQITHTVTEITGIDSLSVVTGNQPDGTNVAVDHLTGAEFSNLGIELALSWIAEQHHFRAPSTTIYSYIDWLIPSARACTLAPPYHDYDPAVLSIDIYSDSDFNEQYPAGSDLTALFTAPGLVGGHDSLFEAAQFGSLQSERTYLLQAAWPDGNLAATPVTPATHVFTVLVLLEDGRAYEMQTPAVLLNGI